jgi:hypothetical protein
VEQHGGEAEHVDQRRAPTTEEVLLQRPDGRPDDAEIRKKNPQFIAERDERRGDNSPILMAKKGSTSI